MLSRVYHSPGLLSTMFPQTRHKYAACVALLRLPALVPEGVIGKKLVPEATACCMERPRNWGSEHFVPRTG
jgi:hypothetical protein